MMTLSNEEIISVTVTKLDKTYFLGNELIQSAYEFEFVPFYFPTQTKTFFYLQYLLFNVNGV